MALGSKYWLSTMVLGLSGLLIAIIGDRSFALSVLAWGWGEQKEKRN